MSASSKIPVSVFGAGSFHQKGITGKKITVAVLDSGLAPHPDIAANRILAFRDFINQQPRPYDDSTHGTHVTGIIASTRIGIAPETNLVSLKVLDRHGNGYTDNFIEAIKWLLIHHREYAVRIVNISVGGNSAELSQMENTLNQWVEKLWDAGLTVCCSAGNNGPSPNSITAPGNCRKVITVGSYDGRRFSSAGPPVPYITKPELVAPGLHILSTKPHGGYSIKNGTSMSVPFISAACALLQQQRPDLTNDQIKIRLMNAARPVPHLPYNIQGAGSVSLSNLLS